MQALLASGLISPSTLQTLLSGLATGTTDTTPAPAPNTLDSPYMASLLGTGTIPGRNIATAAKGGSLLHVRPRTSSWTRQPSRYKIVLLLP